MPQGVSKQSRDVSLWLEAAPSPREAWTSGVPVNAVEWHRSGDRMWQPNTTVLQHALKAVS